MSAFESPSPGDDSERDMTVVLSNYNQERVLARSVTELRAALSSMKPAVVFLLVDDGSTDGTWAVSERLAAEHRDVRLLRQPRNLGRGRGVADGVRAATTELVATLDTDLEVAPQCLAQLVSAVCDGADLALARRDYPLPLGLSRGRELGRWLAHRGYRRLVRGALGTAIDTASGCKVMRRSAMLPVVDAIRDERWFWDTELVVRALRAGRRIVEVPVYCGKKPDDESTVNVIPDTLAYLFKVARLRYDLARER